MPDHTARTNATKRMLKAWAEKGPDFGRTDKPADWWAKNGKQFGTPGPNSMTEMVCNERKADFSAEQLGLAAIAERDETLNRASACMWRMREAAAAVIADYAPMLDQIISLAARTGVPYNFDPHAAANALAAVIDEPPFTSLAIVKREAVREIMAAADRDPNAQHENLGAWLEDNIETFFNE